jgi:hypothetical protein
LLLLLIIRTVVFFKLPSLKSQAIRDALSALFSPWDWRAIHAVKRAITVQSENEESKAISALMHTDSRIYQADLEHYLNSPSIFIRQRAMQALRRAKPTKNLISALERDLMESENPYILIEGVGAISLWGDPVHYSMLLQKYLLDIPPQAKDELSLSVARLLGLYDAFYADLGMLHRHPSQLIREWQERFASPDGERLILAICRGDPQRSLLEAFLKCQHKRFQRWFYDDTIRFLAKLPDKVHREVAFFMAFLLLAPDGFHINR